MIEKKAGTLDVVKKCVNSWFSYVNRDIEETDFLTDILAYIASDEDELKKLKENTITDSIGGPADLIERENVLEKRIATYYDGFTTKDIGGIVESLVHGHECMRIKTGGREDLIDMISSDGANITFDPSKVGQFEELLTWTN